MSKGVLIICQHFVPYTPSVGGVARVAYLAKQLVDRGVNVHVLTSDGVDYGFLGFDEHLSQLSVNYLRDPLKFLVQASLKKATANMDAVSSFSFMSFLRGVKRLVYKLVIPDLGLLMVPRYYFAASRLITSKDIGTVIVSTPPHSMQIVGGLLKKRFGNRIELVADYRDSWNASIIFSQDSAIGSYISKWLERFCLRQANIVTFVSNPMLKKLCALYPELEIEAKGLLVMNGFAGSPSEYSDKTRRLPLRIGYFGMADDDLNGYRNVELLFKAIAAANSAGASLELVFYGSLRLSRLNVEDYPFVQIYDPVPHGKVIEKMHEMDYLLVLHTDPESSDEVVTGKFFDYIQARRPMLCFSPLNMEAARIINAEKIGVWADSSSLEHAVSAFLSLVEEEFPKLKDSLFVHSFSRQGQYSRLIDKLSVP